ncbi:MAG TPA: hypothetical protein VIK77_04860 [Tissierellaceae bacterium]
MSNQPIFWKTRNGRLVSVDDMDTNHIKNAFKHLIKHHQRVVQQANELVDKYNALVRKKKAELEEEIDYDPYNDSIIDGMTDWRET